MITLILAWINSKYDTGYLTLFVGTVIIDIAIVDVISYILK